jgi:hypothetical protein
MAASTRPRLQFSRRLTAARTRAPLPRPSVRNCRSRTSAHAGRGSCHGSVLMLVPLATPPSPSPRPPLAAVARPATHAVRITFSFTFARLVGTVDDRVPDVASLVQVDIYLLEYVHVYVLEYLSTIIKLPQEHLRDMHACAGEIGQQIGIFSVVVNRPKQSIVIITNRNYPSTTHIPRRKIRRVDLRDNLR